MAKVELDRKKIANVDLSQVSPEDVEAMLLDTEEEALKEVEEEDATLTLASIGAKYRVGPIDVNIAIGHLVLLNEIDSPFVNGKIGEVGDELDPIDCIKAIYVLAKGEEAIRPIMAIKQRQQSLLSLKPMVDDNPELFDRLMDRAEKIGESEKEFEMEAMSFYEEHFVGEDLQSVLESLVMALNDIVKMSNDLPVQSGKEKKK